MEGTVGLISTYGKWLEKNTCTRSNYFTSKIELVFAVSSNLSINF